MMSGKTDHHETDPRPERTPAESTGDDAPTAPPSGAAPDPARAPEAAEPAPEPDSDRARLEKLVRERDDYLENLKRERASFLNYKRWAEKERGQARTDAICRFMEELLPFIDDLDRACKAAAEANDVEGLKEGFDMVYRRFHEAVKAAQVEEVPSSGEPFDPRIHEAILQIEDPDHPSGTILETTHRGFRLGDRLIRAARVVVSKNPQSSEESRSDPAEEDERDGTTDETTRAE